MMRFFREERGNVTVLMAAAMVFLIAMAALAIDVGYMYFRKSQVSAYADAASMAGALALREGKDDEEAIKKAVNDNLAANGYTEILTYDFEAQEVGETPNTVYVLIDEGEVHVRLGQPEGWFLAQVLNLLPDKGNILEDPVVAGYAAAKTSPGGSNDFLELEAGIASFNMGGKNKDGVSFKGNSKLSGNTGETIVVWSNYDIGFDDKNIDANIDVEFHYYNKFDYDGGKDYQPTKIAADDRLEPPDLDWGAIRNAAQTGKVYTSKKVNIGENCEWETGAYFPGNLKITDGDILWDGVVFIEDDFEVTGGKFTGHPFVVVQGNVEINGNVDAFSGTIYCRGDIEINGGAETFIGALWAGGNVEFGGGGKINLTYQTPGENITQYFPGSGSIKLIR